MGIKESHFWWVLLIKRQVDRDRKCPPSKQIKLRQIVSHVVWEAGDKSLETIIQNLRSLRVVFRGTVAECSVLETMHITRGIHNKKLRTTGTMEAHWKLFESFISSQQIIIWGHFVSILKIHFFIIPKRKDTSPVYSAWWKQPGVPRLSHGCLLKGNRGIYIQGGESQTER